MKRAWLLVLPLLVGCPTSSSPGGGGSNSSGSGSSSSGGAEPAVVTAFRSFLDAQCEYMERCKATIGPRYTSLSACQASAENDLLYYRGFFETQALSSDVNAAAFSACIAALMQADCSVPVPPSTLNCTAGLEPKNGHMPGAGCSTNDGPDVPRCALAADNFCSAAAAECGTCTAKLADGVACTTDAQCRSGSCTGSAFSKNCGTPPKGENEDCLSRLECRGNLVCVGPFLQKKCVRRAAAGEACSGIDDQEQPICLGDLICDVNATPSTCVSKSPPGQPCGRFASGTECSDFCVFPSATSPLGTCTALTELPTEGQPCVLASTPLGAIPACSSELALDLYADPNGNPDAGPTLGCTCRKRLASGGSCTFGGPGCVSGRCDGATFDMPGMCAPVAANGMGCLTNANCSSGYCSPSFSCQPPPACP